jgi:hypothetical protein
MAVLKDITTGAQSVTATGAITGSLDTSALSGDYTVKIEVSGLSAGKSAQIALEDTANVTPFSDVLQPYVFSFVGGMDRDGVALSVRSYQIPQARFGATNTKLRFNTQAISSTPGSVKVHGWLEQ